MTKTLKYKKQVITLASPASMKFETNFHEVLYEKVYASVAGADYGAYLDVDHLADGSLGVDVVALADASGLKFKKAKEPAPGASNRDRLMVQYYVRFFLNSFPELVGLVFNTVLLANNSIENGEALHGEKCDVSNFIQIKQIIDDVNAGSWTRGKDASESQSGNSTLGQISEGLLTRVFENMVDGENFFQVTAAQVQSYGDFVLMCLPNNLWISVKSNFARERLLASGYSNDILGVGFFGSFKEFVGQVRVRNFQRAGFLAMYCPDHPVTAKQMTSGTSTFEEILAFHKKNKMDLPRNINGQQFIRPLSSVQDDLQKLLDQKDVTRRFTVDF